MLSPIFFLFFFLRGFGTPISRDKSRRKSRSGIIEPEKKNHRFSFSLSLSLSLSFSPFSFFFPRHFVSRSFPRFRDFRVCFFILFLFFFSSLFLVIFSFVIDTSRLPVPPNKAVRRNGRNNNQTPKSTNRIPTKLSIYL